MARSTLVAGGTCVAHYDHDRAAILEGAPQPAGFLVRAWGIEDGAPVVLTRSGADAVSARNHRGVHRMTVRDGRVEAEPLDVRRI
ncbi:MAG: hypothetical protein OES24_08600 [Acidimicrobiia bacterium]|nr:hypothetical protein [Acidimicrobiia bacterium]